MPAIASSKVLPLSSTVAETEAMRARAKMEEDILKEDKEVAEDDDTL